MNLSFEPRYPPESAETMRGTMLPLQDFVVPVAALPTREASDHEEVPPPTNAKKIERITFIDEACIARGQEAEDVFLELAVDAGWTPLHIAEADYYDYRHHVDLMFRFQGREIWVDVKSLRALRRGGALQNEFFFVELMRSGWLYGGLATIVALQIAPRSFALFDKAKLADYARCHIDTSSPVVPWPEQALNRVYMRESSRKCALSLLDTLQAFAAAGCGLLSAPTQPPTPPTNS